MVAGMFREEMIMRDLLKVCRDPFRVLRARPMITVREAEFGYQIRSDRGPIGAHRRDLFAFAAIALAWLAGAAMWFAPGLTPSAPSFLAKVGISALLLAGTSLLVLRNRSWGQFVTDVDLGKRVLRFAVESAGGKGKIQCEARFGEVSSPMLKRAVREGEKSRLLVKVAGREDLLLLAAGEELTLLAVHDRLLNDLRPIEPRMASYGAWDRKASPSATRKKVFPALGPSEVSA